MATPTIRRIIFTPKAPAPIGPYNQAILVDKTMYISGQIGLDAASGTMAPDIQTQTHQTLKNVGYILNAANSTFNNVVKATVLLADINDFDTVNSIYSQYFTDKAPARAAYQVANLPKAARVEIETVAIVGDIIDQ